MFLFAESKWCDKVIESSKSEVCRRLVCQFAQTFTLRRRINWSIFQLQPLLLLCIIFLYLCVPAAAQSFCSSVRWQKAVLFQHISGTEGVFHPPLPNTHTHTHIIHVSCDQASFQALFPWRSFKERFICVFSLVVVISLFPTLLNLLLIFIWKIGVFWTNLIDATFSIKSIIFDQYS